MTGDLVDSENRKDGRGDGRGVGRVVTVWWETDGSETYSSFIQVTEG